MDHDEIKRRISRAQPDLLFVSFGCPKQEKWIAMHYQSLGVPVAIGVGGTIDFLAGQLKRAPVWMQRTGTEWIFRLLQEPRRLFKRYARDLGVFGTSLLAQWWTMQIRKFGSQDNSLDGQCSVPRSVSSRNTIVRRHVQIASSRCCVERAGSIGGGFVPGLMLRHGSKKGCASSRIKANADWQWIQLPKILDVTTIKNDALLGDPILADGRHCLLQMDRVQFIDSTGMGWLMRLRKKIRATGKQLVLIDAHPAVNRALKLLHIQEFFAVAPDFDAARILIQDISFEQREWVRANSCRVPKQIVSWRGEITAANADPVWQETEKLIRPEADSPQPLVIDLSQVRFMDSSGLGVMVRARKLAQREGVQLSFDGPQPAVLNVLRIAQLENFLLGQLS
jgi:N-acetylglucosaminyldiphosphoundecaprenol N-acetyl-beta-D-mannosaminyltransferase